MQLSLIETIADVDYSNKKVMIGLSGGINSAAVLVYLVEHVTDKPKDIYLYYCHLDEHSPDTKPFVLALVEYAKQHFDRVVFESSDHSMTDFCRDEFKGIPHPSVSACTRILKIQHIVDFMRRYEIDVDIVGYVRSEYRRIENQIKRDVKNKDYLISHLSDEDCFSLVKNHIGWYPAIYDIKWADKRIGEALVVRGGAIGAESTKDY